MLESLQTVDKKQSFTLVGMFFFSANVAKPDLGLKCIKIVNSHLFHDILEGRRRWSCSHWRWWSFFLRVHQIILKVYTIQGRAVIRQ